jgi:hypothetical protein
MRSIGFSKERHENGDAIPGLAGWEHHGEPADIPGLEILAKGPVFSGGRPQGGHTATIYPGRKAITYSTRPQSGRLA